MGSSYLPPPEQNVVNVGDELSQTALDAINAASFPSGTNPFRTINDGGVISAYDNFKVYQAGEVVTEGGLIYVFNSTIGAAGYGPTTHPYAWTSMQGQQGQQGPQGNPGPQGQTGDPGPQGQTGNSTIVWRGGWSWSQSYNSGDIVSYNGTSWGATQSSYNLEPTSNPYHWQVVAEKGQDGSNGSNGADGPQGQTGDPGPMGPGGQPISIWNNFTDYPEWSLVYDDQSPYDRRTPYIAKVFVSQGGFRPSDGSSTNQWEILGSGWFASLQEQSNVLSALNGKANLSGATFTGKVTVPTRSNSGATAAFNLGAISQNLAAPTTLLDGDVFLIDVDSTSAWNTRLCYVGKAFSGTQTTFQLAVTNGQTNFFSQPQAISTNATTAPALRINQNGTTQPALVVEDDTTPDTTSLVVTNGGNVGIGVAAGHTGTQKLEVVGNVKADGFVNGTGPVFKVNGTQTHSGGSDTHELLMSVNGSTYRIGMRFVSTP